MTMTNTSPRNIRDWAHFCGPCCQKLYRKFMRIKGWAIRFERWGLPKWFIGMWWTFWTPE